VRDIRKYEVFQLADRLVLRVYRATTAFPREELFGLTAQMRRAACSIPMNLVEGASRPGNRDFGHFVSIAIGSCEELRYQVHLAQELGYMADSVAQELEEAYIRVVQMLSKLASTVAGRGQRAAAGGKRSLDGG